YMSPADSNQEIKGVYGNGSEPSPRTIPTLVEGDDRAGEDLPTFTYDATDYGAYFLNTLYEVLTQYGQIDEVVRRRRGQHHQERGVRLRRVLRHDPPAAAERRRGSGWPGRALGGHRGWFRPAERVGPGADLESAGRRKDRSEERRVGNESEAGRR